MVTQTMENPSKWRSTERKGEIAEVRSKSRLRPAAKRLDSPDNLA